jgi:hypothetical protein
MTDPKPAMHNHLPQNFYVMPEYARTTLTTKQLRETYLATDGWIMACGYSWNIVSKSMGAGVHSVTLERQR